MVQNFKKRWLYYVTKCMLSAAVLFMLPACVGNTYQPQVPEHLQDHE
ncbi:cyclic lactone autoinducer peptide [Sporomusa sphaeroides]